MDSKRIQEIHEQTAYPDSISVQQALLRVWNECAREHNIIKREMLRIFNNFKLDIEIMNDSELPQDTKNKLVAKIDELLDEMRKLE